MESAAKIIRKSYKFRIYPSKSQVSILETTLDLCRELYNAGLQERRDAWKITRQRITLFDQQNQLSEIKITREDLKIVYAQVLQETLSRLDKTFQAFFGRVKQGERAGFPRFKGSNRYDSFTYPQKGFRLEGSNLYLSKVGKLKVRLSRNVIGKVKTCTIKREISGWFVIFSVETIKEVLPKTGKQIGVDAGIENFLTLSDGTQIKNHKYFEHSQKKLRIAQRSISRKKNGSISRRKAVLKLRKIHQKITNQRNDFQHKISTRLVRDFDLIAIELLNISGLSKGFLAKQISDAAWGNFFNMLRYKAENAGKKLVEVNPNGTSQTCVCGTTVKKDLSVRVHHCQECGYKNHRDIVSAQVILKLGLGHNLKDVTYRDTESVSLEFSIQTL